VTTEEGQQKTEVARSLLVQLTQVEIRIRINMKNPINKKTNSSEEQLQNATKMTKDQHTAKPD